MGREDWAVVDTETTGCGQDDELVEVAVVSSSGEVTFERTLKPQRGVSPGAFRLHGLDGASLRTSPRFAAIATELRDHIAGKLLVAYHAAFDQRMLTQAYRDAGQAAPVVHWECALDKYEQWRGFRPSLAVACEIEGIDPAGRQHRAAVDAHLVWALIGRMARG